MYLTSHLLQGRKDTLSDNSIDERSAPNRIGIQSISSFATDPNAPPSQSQSVVSVSKSMTSLHDGHSAHHKKPTSSQDHQKKTKYVLRGGFKMPQINSDIDDNPRSQLLDGSTVSRFPEIRENSM